MFIAAAVGEGLDRDGKNKDSITSYKALNEGKRNQVLRLKKAAVKMMQANHGKLPVLYLEGTCDESRTYIEHGMCYTLLPIAFSNYMRRPYSSYTINVILCLFS